MHTQLIPADVRMNIVLECIKFSNSRSCKMAGLEVNLQQLMQHLKIVNDIKVAPLASKVLCACACVRACVCVCVLKLCVVKKPATLHPSLVEIM